jgi:uncharacterized cupredoxin-like copper-binding protein
MAVAIVALAVLLSAGCSGGGEHAGAPTLRVTERDFRITAPRHVAPGPVRLQVDNNGPDTHELIVVRKNGRRLPIRADGLTVDEEALKPDEAGGLEPGAPGAKRELGLHLARGRYELFCNMAGHYLGGMHTDLVVG